MRLLKTYLLSLAVVVIALQSYATYYTWGYKDPISTRAVITYKWIEIGGSNCVYDCTTYLVTFQPDGGKHVIKVPVIHSYYEQVNKGDYIYTTVLKGDLYSNWYRNLGVIISVINTVLSIVGALVSCLYLGFWLARRDGRVVIERVPVASLSDALTIQHGKYRGGKRYES